MTSQPQRPKVVPFLTLTLTRAGLLAERTLRAFWPLLSILMAVLAALMLGLQDLVAVEAVWVAGAIATAVALWAAVYGIRRFRWPGRAEALDRLDETLPGRPIQAVLDAQVIGETDAASRALWRAHQKRMAERAADARAVPPNLRLARSDPFGLRYMATLALLVALLFGSVWRVSSVADMAPGAAAAATGPSWEGWIEPPRYTGLPTLYLNDQKAKSLSLPQGSRLTLRLFGEVGSLSVTETVSNRDTGDPAAPEQSFDIARSGQLRIDGSGGREWVVELLPDNPPGISVAGPAEAEITGQMALPFIASDDYGVTGGNAVIRLDLAALNRRHGLRADPDPRDPVELDLPLPIAGDRREFEEKLIEDLSQHPWAHLPVTVTLTAEDAAGNQGMTTPFGTLLPARRFFDPMAGAIVEMRRDLLWARSNAPRVAQVLRAVSHRPESAFRSETAYLRLRVILRRLETFTRYGLKPEQQDEIAEALWDLAILLEEGDIGDALERMRQAQERLSEAMKNGASDQEIAELMQELREATEDYLRQLQRQAQSDPSQQGQNGEIPENSTVLSQDDLQQMMDRIQELMEQGRMAEAEQALQEFQQMMENMRMTQAQRGQGGQTEGDRAMEGLAETLRDQQGLSDQAFRDLQEQFNPGAQSGESEGNEGRSGGLGRGQSHEGGQGSGRSQGGEGEQEGEQGGGQSAEGRGQQQGPGGDEQGQAGSLADRQQALRNELRRQQGNLPGAGTPEGDAARESLGRAGRSMEQAEEALRNNDLAEAIDNQSDAMEALREGMRELGEAMAQQQGQQDGQGNMQGANRDPLGREPLNGDRSSGGFADQGRLPSDLDEYGRAFELLDELRRRSGETGRSLLELDYLKRLMERF
ncbi:TIGR02302 family protein [Primorskyibacter sp. S87]|uniref:TIGR02302 family protein n=1 Tax=Primorskyibacter sp. S87 TaxID=3415126 RepID=UPI003C7DF133